MILSEVVLSFVAGLNDYVNTAIKDKKSILNLALSHLSKIKPKE
jgi:hypothetical protein